MKDFIKFIYTKRRPLFFLTADIVLISLAVWLAFLLRFDGQIPFKYIEGGALAYVIILALIFTLPIFYSFRLYSFSWSYVSTSELIALLKASFFSFLALAVIFLFLKDQVFFQGFPRSTLFISYFLIFILCGGIRFAKRIYLRSFKRRGEEKKERILIVGAGDAGEQILRSIFSLNGSPYLPVGFVDDNSLKQGVLIHGLKVLGRINDIPQAVRENKAGALIIALPSAGSGAIKRAVEMGRRAGLKKIKIVPSMGDIIGGEVSIRDVREVRIEDLLGREPVGLDTGSIESFIRDKRVLITGAAGSIGSELSRQVARFGPSALYVLDQDETGIFNISGELRDKFANLNIVSLVADVRNKERISQVFETLGPNVVFHAAAYKHVPLMEEHPGEAVKNNIFGTKVVAEASIKNGAEKFVLISTDKAVNPTSIMGATKRMGEMICQNLNKKSETNFVSVRFGNVLDSRGSVIPVFKEQIKNGGPVEVTHPEMKRYFMMIPEAVLLVMQAGAMGSGGEVFVLDMGQPVKIIDLAKELITLSGFEPDKDIPIVFTEPRPGEKLFEEILTAEEGTVATQNQKIFMAKLSDGDELKLERALAGLEQAASKEDIVTVLKSIIPSYKSF